MVAWVQLSRYVHIHNHQTSMLLSGSGTNGSFGYKWVFRVYVQPTWSVTTDVHMLQYPDNYWDYMGEMSWCSPRWPCCFGALQAENDEPLLKEEPHVDFTGEEALGRYLDLHEHHMTFINSKFGKKVGMARGAVVGLGGASVGMCLLLSFGARVV